MSKYLTLIILLIISGVITSVLVGIPVYGVYIAPGSIFGIIMASYLNSHKKLSLGNALLWLIGSTASYVIAFTVLNTISRGRCFENPNCGNFFQIILVSIIGTTLLTMLTSVLTKNITKKDYPTLLLNAIIAGFLFKLFVYANVELFSIILRQIKVYDAILTSSWVVWHVIIGLTLAYLVDKNTTQTETNLTQS